MRISDWTSDVCSSDLASGLQRGTALDQPVIERGGDDVRSAGHAAFWHSPCGVTQSVGWVSLRDGQDARVPHSTWMCESGLYPSYQTVGAPSGPTAYSPPYRTRERKAHV